MLVGCVLVALWLVFVPVSALFYNAFTEDTGFGPGAFSLQNFVDAYSDGQSCGCSAIRCSLRSVPR